jgi:hypothetical protein
MNPRDIENIIKTQTRLVAELLDITKDQQQRLALHDVQTDNLNSRLLVLDQRVAEIDNRTATSRAISTATDDTVEVIR